MICTRVTRSTLRKDCLRAVASDRMKLVFNVRHLRSRILPFEKSPSVANGGCSSALSTRWSFHWNTVLLSTGFSYLIPQSSVLTWGTMAGSYFQCLITDAMEVHWEMADDAELPHQTGGSNYSKTAQIARWKRWDLCADNNIQNSASNFYTNWWMVDVMP